MKVKHPISNHPASEVRSGMAADEAGDLRVNDPTMPKLHLKEGPQTNEAPRNLQSKDNDLEADLAFEHELLQPGSQVTAPAPKVWRVKDLDLKLSTLEATVAIKSGIFTYEELVLYTPPKHTPVDSGPSDPLTGALSAALGAVGTVAQRVGDYPLLLAKVLEAKQDGEAEKAVADFAKDGSRGVTGIVGAGLKAPVDITHNVARGFHNLPKLYGDETVRPTERVTDVESGMMAAGKGFGYGIWDGLSGLVTQPVKGAQEGGWMGGLAGLGKGVGGAVFKPAAGAFGIPGYAFKGIYEEVQKNMGAGQDKETSLVEEQMVQGFREWETTSEKERELVLLRIKRKIEDLETLEG